jgi:proteasome lid subunit RPN8/RPN11
VELGQPLSVESGTRVIDEEVKIISTNTTIDGIRLAVSEQENKDKVQDYQLTIVIRNAALGCAQKHAHLDTSLETGGVLLGQFIPHEESKTEVVITGIVRATRAIRRFGSLNFTPETWAEIWRCIDRDQHYSDDNIWKIVGWYHTHPTFGIFLSSMDLSIHHQFFTNPNHVALVIDPIRGKHGYFCWNKQQNKIVRYPDNLVIEINGSEKYTKYKFSSLLPSEVKTATD